MVWFGFFFFLFFFQILVVIALVGAAFRDFAWERTFRAAPSVHLGVISKKRQHFLVIRDKKSRKAEKLKREREGGVSVQESILFYLLLF